MKVTDENFGELRLGSLREAAAIERGEMEAARRVLRGRTSRTADGAGRPTDVPRKEHCTSR